MRMVSCAAGGATQEEEPRRVTLGRISSPLDSTVSMLLSSARGEDIRRAEQHLRRFKVYYGEAVSADPVLPEEPRPKIVSASTRLLSSSVAPKPAPAAATLYRTSHASLQLAFEQNVFHKLAPHLPPGVCVITKLSHLLCCNKVKLSPWKVSIIHANAP